MKYQKILIVEDDKNISNLVKYNLEKADLLCEDKFSGEDALKYLDTHEVDLIILDIMLPGINGLETCKKIKRKQHLSSIPIIMLTAKGEEIDRIVGFELGADDYVVKPFSPRELVLRVKAILNRKDSKKVGNEIEIYTVGAVKVDIPRCEVTVDDKEIHLTAMEFKLLVTLIQRKGRVQTRDQLLDDVWNLDADVTTRTVDTHIKRLRQKMGESGNIIETVRGYGYRLSEKV